jgi:hypothetical protein
MLMKKLFLLTIASLLAMTANASASPGSFFIPGSALPVIRQQIDRLPGGVAAATAPEVQNLRFVYNPDQDTLESWNGTRSSTRSLPGVDKTTLHQPGSITISGTVALAVLKGMAARKRAIPARFLGLEQAGRLTISGYDHGDSVFFVEHFEGIRPKAWTPGTLDTCSPGVQYVIDVPSFAITNFVINDC